MITREQCRAARGLLNWTQKELATASGLSKTAINNFERNTSDIRKESLLAIKTAFEDEGIEFIDDYGVHKSHDTVRVLKGSGALAQLWNDIFDTLQNTGGEVLISNIDESRSYECAPIALENHLRRLQEHNITERLLACEGDTFFLQPRECYRWLSRDVFQAGMSSFIYGRKVALQFWQESMIIIVQSTDASNAERKRFELLWKNAKPVPPQTS